MTQEELTITWNLSKMVFLNSNGIEHQHLLNQVDIYDIRDGFCYLHSSSNYVVDELKKMKEKIQDAINQVLKLKGYAVEVVIKKKFQQIC